MEPELTEKGRYSSNSVGRSRWWARMPRSVVQNGTRRAELWATRRRSNGSRVQSSRRAWRTMVASGTSSTVNRVSSITVCVNSGLRTESRPTSPRNWISRKETGETPQGRYRSNHGNSASRFEPRTSQIRKWVSRRRFNALTAAVKRGHVQDASSKTIDPLSRHPARGGVVCTAEHLWYFETWPLPPGAARPGDLCAVLRLPRRREPRRVDETNVSWLLTQSRSSYVQCTRRSERSSRRASTFALLTPWRDSWMTVEAETARVKGRAFVTLPHESAKAREN
jgi:hypothetical protein